VSRAQARTLISAEELRRGVRRLAGELSAAYEDGVVLVAVLKGSVPFLADMTRQMSIVPEVDFMSISSYAPDTGRVRIIKDLETDVSGRDVVLVEDIVDTGLTLTYLRGEIHRREARSVAACTLLDRAVRRIVPTPIEFVGFQIEDDFVLGYGLDFAERYRNLDRVIKGDLTALQHDPDAYVQDLYSG
jgi:hypoxanthine phosphoribosyltransferase